MLAARMLRERRRGARAAPTFFARAATALARGLAATHAAQRRATQARNRLQATRAWHDRRIRLMKRHQRARRLIELGKLVVKAGLAELAGDDPAALLGLFLEAAETLKSDEREEKLSLWREHGRRALADENGHGP